MNAWKDYHNAIDIISFISVSTFGTHICTQIILVKYILRLMQAQKYENREILAQHTDSRPLYRKHWYQQENACQSYSKLHPTT